MSYRRQDSADVTGRIYDRLRRHFGSDTVFKDVDSIPLGADFRRYIETALGSASVFVCVIGPDWAGADKENRSIDSEHDFVRVETAVALDRKIAIIPALVRGAKMPSEAELPDSIKALAFRNGTPVRPDPDFEGDIQRLIHGINELYDLKETRAN